MSRVRAFGRFWWNFVVGDDWVAAAGIVVAIGITAAIAAEKVAAWWFLPLAVAAVLGMSLYREARSASR
jgi:hydrogenase/urease accessory protein HupE